MFVDWKDPAVKMSIVVRTIKALNDPMRWTNWPYLPLIKRTSVTKDDPMGKQLGLVIFCGTKLRLYRDANMFIAPSTWKNASDFFIGDIDA
jgi:hypothetical protein